MSLDDARAGGLRADHAVVVCAPVSADGTIDSSFGRARRIAVARVEDGTVTDLQDELVAWDEVHDTGTEGGHHARVARFLRDHAVDVVLARHLGPDMAHMLERMGITVRLGAAGDVRASALETAAAHASEEGREQ